MAPLVGVTSVPYKVRALMSVVKLPQNRKMRKCGKAHPFYHIVMHQLCMIEIHGLMHVSTLIQSIGPKVATFDNAKTINTNTKMRIECTPFSGRDWVNQIY